MARKYGKKNIVKLDPLAYNIGILGESGIGKSGLIYEVCDKLVGEEGYIMLNIGREKGLDAIQGVIGQDIKSWSEYKDFINEVSYNKDTDYKELKVVVLDTIDELSDLAEKEVIRQHNIKNPNKKCDSINSAFGGFGAGQQMISEIILKSIDDLRNVGVNVVVVGHTKRKAKNDVVTGEEFDVITAKITDRLFTDIKTKLDILGMGIIKREVKREVIGQDIMGKDKIHRNTKSAERVIAFRSEGYAIDSKSRFADIVDEIEFSADAFIKAITEAIKKAYDKKDVGVTVEQAKVQQQIDNENKIIKNVEKFKSEADYGDPETMVEFIKSVFKSDESKKESIVTAMKAIGEHCKSFDVLKEETTENIITIYKIASGKQ